MKDSDLKKVDDTPRPSVNGNGGIEHEEAKTLELVTQ
jgi:hypothetical protein